MATGFEMAEGMTCYEQDESLCDDQMCLRTGCKLRNAALSQEPYETPDGDLFWMVTQLRYQGGWQRKYADALWKEILHLSTAHHTAVECCAKIADRAAAQHADNPSRSAMAEEIAASIRSNQNKICTWCGSDIHCGAAECGHPKTRS